MFKDIISAITKAVRSFFTRFGATLLALVVYALLLAVAYSFLTTGERTATQVIMSLLILPLLGLVLFFVLQGLGITSTSDSVGTGARLRVALANCWKLLLVSIPLVLVAWLAHYGYGKATAKLQYDDKKMRAALEWAWLLVFYLVLPLSAAHLWIAATRESLGATFRRYLLHVVRAFAPRSLAVFAVVWLVFGGLAYVLLFTFKTQFGGPWVELGLLGLRMLAAALLVFVAWYVSLGALVEVTAPKIKAA
jgi:hypothetical protein